MVVFGGNTMAVSSNIVLPEKYLIPSPHKKGLHGVGFGPHPRNDVKTLSEAVTGLLRPEAIAPRCTEPAASSSSEAGNVRGAVSTYFENQCSISALFQAVVMDRAGTPKHGPTSTEWRRWRDHTRRGRSNARVHLARAAGNLVSLSCRRRTKPTRTSCS